MTQIYNSNTTPGYKNRIVNNYYVNFTNETYSRQFIVHEPCLEAMPFLNKLFSMQESKTIELYSILTKFDSYNPNLFSIEGLSEAFLHIISIMYDTDTILDIDYSDYDSGLTPDMLNALNVSYSIIREANEYYVIIDDSNSSNRVIVIPKNRSFNTEVNTLYFLTDILNIDHKNLIKYTSNIVQSFIQDPKHGNMNRISTLKQYSNSNIMYLKSIGLYMFASIAETIILENVIEGAIVKESSSKLKTNNYIVGKKEFCNTYVTNLGIELLDGEVFIIHDVLLSGSRSLDVE